MLLALTLSALISLMLLRGTNNIAVVLTVFGVGYLVLQQVFKSTLKRFSI